MAAGHLTGHVVRLRLSEDPQIGITFVTLGELTRWATLRQMGPNTPRRA